MRLVLVLSGAVGSGKSTVAEAVLTAVGGRRISTRQLIIELTGVESRREALQEAGDALDESTGFGWVADAAARLEDQAAHDVLIVDAVRKPEQIERLRQRFTTRVRHVHVVASQEELERRHRRRRHDVEEPESYEAVRASATEQGVKDLAHLADLIIDVTRLDPGSVAASALAGTGLNAPKEKLRLVDVLVGGQYGSEGKGNICSFIASEYQVLIRVGGPNAGHIVYNPHYKFAQLPSGTLHNKNARLILGPGTTLSLAVARTEPHDFTCPDRGGATREC